MIALFETSVYMCLVRFNDSNFTLLPPYSYFRPSPSLSPSLSVSPLAPLRRTTKVSEEIIEYAT